MFDILFNETQFLSEILSYISCLKQRNDDVIYFDEFEPNNSLGSHSGFKKLVGVYIKIPCVPEYLQAQLSHIFVAMLLFSDDRKKFGNTSIFTPFIEELNFLQTTGIEIKNHVDGGRFNKVKIIPSLIN